MQSGRRELYESVKYVNLCGRNSLKSETRQIWKDYLYFTLPVEKMQSIAENVVTRSCLGLESSSLERKGAGGVVQRFCSGFRVGVAVGDVEKWRH